MLPALELFERVCSFESKKEFVVQNFVIPTKKLKDACKSLVITSCKETTKAKYTLKLSQPTRSFKLNFDKECNCAECCNCSCVYFLDHAFCKHLLHLYNFNQINPPGVVTKKTFSIKIRRGRPKQASRALQV
jgi:hypothetical protein